MRFLIDAGLPRATRDLMVSLGHDAVDVRDIGIGAAPDESIFERAATESRCLITRDGDFGDLTKYDPRKVGAIVVVVVHHLARRDHILQVVGAFLSDAEVLREIAGKLVIVEPTRVRIRSVDH